MRARDQILHMKKVYVLLQSYSAGNRLAELLRLCRHIANVMQPAHECNSLPNHPTLTRSGLQKSHTSAWRFFYGEGGRTHAAHIHTNTCSCLFKGCRVWEQRLGEVPAFFRARVAEL